MAHLSSPCCLRSGRGTFFLPFIGPHSFAVSRPSIFFASLPLLFQISLFSFFFLPPWRLIDYMPFRFLLVGLRLCWVRSGAQLIFFFPLLMRSFSHWLVSPWALDARSLFSLGLFSLRLFALFWTPDKSFDPLLLRFTLYGSRPWVSFPRLLRSFAPRFAMVLIFPMRAIVL